MYIDTGTFWVISIGLAIAIGAVYFTLKDKVEHPKLPKSYKDEIDKSVKELAATAAFDIQDFAKEVDKKLIELGKALDDELSDIRKTHEQDMRSVGMRLFTPDDIRKIANEKRAKK